MLETAAGSWIALFILGAIHGLNPGMGWLFAVALGLQEGSGRAVWRALPPLLLGHLGAIGVALGAAALLGLAFAPARLGWIVAASLVGLGVFQLRRRRHPRFGGMRVGARGLALWSFLMATAHGAGLMALPFVPGAPDVTAPHHLHAADNPSVDAPGQSLSVGNTIDPAPSASLGTPASPGSLAYTAPSPLTRGLAASLIHTAGYLLMTGAVGAIVYYYLGLRMLQRLWINLDQIWAGALILTGVIVLLTG